MSQEIIVKPYRALEIMQQEARKNRSSRITWNHITKNKKYSLLISQNNLYASHEDHLKKLKLVFKKAVEGIPQTLTDKNGKVVSRYYYDQQNDEFVRRNEFEQIKNEDTLLRFVEKSPKGVTVSDELLQFTYKDVQRDIDKLLIDKKIKKINSSNKTRKDYYIFPNTVERLYGLQESYEYFGKDDYLQICKKNYRAFQDNSDSNAQTTTTSFSFSNQKFNEWVPGYVELKKKWVLQNQAKEKQKLNKS